MGSHSERMSNFELLRIVAIIFIILHHIAVHGNWGNGGVFFPETLNINSLFLQAILPLGKIGVTIFVLISGYFLIESTKSTWPKLAKIWGQLLFYSVLISLLFVLFQGKQFSGREWFFVFTPFLSYIWWFASTYIIMLALSPFINKLLHACSQSDHLKLIIVAVALWSVVPTFMNISLQINELVWFVVLYVIAAYIRLYPQCFDKSVRHYLAVALPFFTILVVIAYIVDLTGFRCEFWNIQNIVDHNNMINSVFQLVISLSIFLAFRKMEIKYCKSINVIASVTFGVYLIHDHPLVRGWIYSSFFDCASHTFFPFLPLYVIWMMIVIFVCTGAIEYVRSLLVDKYVFKGNYEMFSNLNKRFDLFIDGIIGKKEQ